MNCLIGISKPKRNEYDEIVIIDGLSRFAMDLRVSRIPNHFDYSLEDNLWGVNYWPPLPKIL